MNVVLRTAAIVCIPLVCLTGPPRPAGAGEPASPAKTSPFRLTLQQAAPLTSAGVYAPNGRLVRQLWAMKPLPAGEHIGEWDGNDEFGRPAPAGPYTWRVVAVSRDPRDGLLDVFGEDSWLNRNVWYRVDDRDVRTLTGALVLKP